MLFQPSQTLEVRRYWSDLRHRVRLAWNVGKNDLQSICRRAAGAFPTDVAETWRDFTGTIPDAGRRAKPLSLGAAATLPEPLLIDFDWRFDAPSARYVARKAANCGRVLCIGTPTVYMELMKCGRDAFLIDRNFGLAKAFGSRAAGRVFFGDVRDGLPPGLDQFDAVVLDPPWYLTEYHRWLSVALPALRRFGTAFIVLFPELTRPGAFRQREQLLRFLSLIGDVCVLSRPVLYVTPPFERIVLEGAGLPSLPAWRLASVAALNVHRPQSAIGSGENFVKSPARVWRRFQIRGRTIAHEEFRVDRRPVAHRPLPGKINLLLNSVSSRAFDHSAINMITSRNRGGIVQGTEKISKMLALLEDGYGSSTAISRISAGNVAETVALHRIIEDFELLV